MVKLIARVHAGLADVAVNTSSSWIIGIQIVTSQIRLSVFGM